MFSRYFWREQVQRYRASRHKARIDHVAGSLVAQRYLDVVVADHLREWLRLTMYFDTKGLPLPSSVLAPDVQEYIAQRPGGRSAPRLRFVRAAARLFLETDAAGYCRRRIGGAPGRPMSAWLAPVADAYRVFLVTTEGSRRALCANGHGICVNSARSWSRWACGRSPVSRPHRFSSSWRSSTAKSRPPG